MPKPSFRRGGGVKHPFADWDLLKPEIDAITKQLGHFPSYGELGAMDRYDVRNAIRDHHGGFVKVRRRMGVALAKKTGDASLRKWNNFSSDIRDIAKELGHFPSTKELVKRKRSDLAAGFRLHGGVDNVRQRMGFALGHRSGKRSLKKWETFKGEVLAVKKQLGHFPSWGELEDLKRQDLLNGFKYHGGVIKVRERLGEPLLVKTGRHSLRIRKNLRAALEPIIKRYGTFPSTKLLSKIGRSDLSHAIFTFPGGTNAARKEFGFKPLKRPPAESFRQWQNAERALRRLRRTFGHFPTDTELVATGNAALAQAIRVYHGGLRKARERFEGAKPEKKPERKLTPEEKILFFKAKSGSDAEKLALISHLEPIIRKWVGIEALREKHNFELRQDLRQQAIVGILSDLARSENPNHFYGTVEKVVKGEVKRLMRARTGFSFRKKDYSQMVVIAQTGRRLLGKLGRTPTDAEVSKASTIPLVEIQRLRKRYPISLFKTDEFGTPLIYKQSVKPMKF